jgi:membrane protein
MRFFRLLEETFADWREDRAARLSAALAYSSVFSLAPLLIIAISIAGAVFGGRRREVPSRARSRVPSAGRRRAVWRR